MTGAPDAAGELARRGLVRRADLLAMGVPVADLDALGAATAGWLIAPEIAVERAPRSRTRSPRTTPPTRSTPACRSRPPAAPRACPTRG